MNVMAVPVADYIGLSAVIFFIGVAGVIVRRNPLIMLMSIELMFNAVGINFVAFNRYVHPGIWGQGFTLFIIALAAAEAVVGLALVLTIYRSSKTVLIERMNILRG